ncbi:MAG: hypothetical protein OEY49_19320 [Candidatus Heimdallarchaeota archaeon]|nr:hypothetical protein [Candidatus Heimdallarchaeota archaeon]
MTEMVSKDFDGAQAQSELDEKSSLSALEMIVNSMNSMSFQFQALESRLGRLEKYVSEIDVLLRNHKHKEE